MIAHTKGRGTNLVSIDISRERLDNKKSTKFLDRVLFCDLVLNGNAFGGHLEGFGEACTEEECDALGVLWQHVLIHRENSVRDDGRVREGHRESSRCGTSHRILGLLTLAFC